MDTLIQSVRNIKLKLKSSCCCASECSTTLGENDPDDYPDKLKDDEGQ